MKKGLGKIITAPVVMLLCLLTQFLPLSGEDSASWFAWVLIMIFTIPMLILFFWGLFNLANPERDIPQK